MDAVPSRPRTGGRKPRRALAAFLGLQIGLGCLSGGCSGLDPAPTPRPPVAPTPEAPLVAPAKAEVPPVADPSLALPAPASGVIPAAHQAPAQDPDAKVPDAKGPEAGPAPTEVPATTPVPTPDLPAGPTSLIDLGSSWRLAGVSNPTIALAEEAVREALALQLGADWLLLPSVTVGGNLHWHQGTLQASPGFIRTLNSQSLYYGLGSRTLAAEALAFPGIRLFSHLGDAIFEPLAAQQRVAARRFEAAATQHNILLDVTVAYLELLGAETRLEFLRESESQMEQVVESTAGFARTGAGRLGDYNRARTRRQLLVAEIQQAEEAVAVASARLASLLNLSPAVRLRTPPGDVRPVDVVPPDTPLPELLDQAVRVRPEVLAATAEVARARVRVRQERTRPWLPLLSVGYSAGSFGGGGSLVSYSFTNFSGRADFDAFAVWTFQNVGFGNRAIWNTREAELGQAIARSGEVVNQVRREVSEALALVQSRRVEMEAARQQLIIASQGFRLDLLRTRANQGLPLETLDNLRLLVEARMELVRAVIAYNEAQFGLYVAVGCSPVCRPQAAEQLLAPPTAPAPAEAPPALPAEEGK